MPGAANAEATAVHAQPVVANAETAAVRGETATAVRAETTTALRAEMTAVTRAEVNVAARVGLAVLGRTAGVLGIALIVTGAIRGYALTEGSWKEKSIGAMSGALIGMTPAEVEELRRASAVQMQEATSPAGIVPGQIY
jgi:hypothetical protein